MKFSNFFLVSTLILPMVASLKIMLHSDFGSKSHVKALLEIATELQNRHHEILYVAVDNNERFLKGYNNMTFISLGFNKKLAEFINKPRPLVDSRKEIDILVTMTGAFSKMIPLSYKYIYPRLEKVVHSKQPDVIICDFFSPACRDVAEVNEIPLISGFQTTDGFGINDAKYLTHEISYKPITTESLSFFERFYDGVIYSIRAAYHFQSVINNINQARVQFGVPKSKFPFGDFSRTLGIANTFVGFEAAVATPPNIKQVGPIMSNFSVPLTEELSSFLEQHRRSLYVAFGSTIELVSYDINNIIIGCFKAMEQGSIDSVIWGLGKTKKDNFPEVFRYNNETISRDDLFSHPQFRILDWAPQETILKHPKTVAFLSHGGLESTFEAILSKTPILCMAYFGDQPRNAKKIELAGIGSYINRYTIDPSKMADKIIKLLDNPALPYNLERMFSIAKLNGRIEYAANLIETYANNAKQCRPNQPYVYGQPGCEAAHLVPASYQMGLIKANQIDTYFLAFVLTTLFGLSVFLITYRLFFLAKRHASTLGLKSKSKYD